MTLELLDDTQIQEIATGLVEESCVSTEELDQFQLAFFNKKFRLVSFEAQGFKSFGSKVSIFFPSGLTAIVGPNGCGKSNIVDAIRWALGEQSNKAIRADKSAEFLFAGAQGQRPATMASVSLRLRDCAEGRDFEVQRRLFRTQESEYRLNQKKVRLKDVQLLFADTGLGKGAFAIIEQGKIEQMLMMSAMQRRLLLEEAAGIRAFKERKQESLKQWQKGQAQLESLQAVYGDWAQRLAKLKEQMDRAQDYKRLKAREFYLKKQLALFLWQGGQERISQLEQNMDEQNSFLEKLESKSQEFQLLRKEKEKELKRACKLSEQWQTKKTTLQAQIDQTKERLKGLCTNQELLCSQEERTARELRQNQAQFQEVQKRLEESKSKREESARAIAKINTQNLHENQEALEQELENAAEELHKREREIIEFTQNSKGIKERLELLQAQYEKESRDFTSFCNRVKQLEEQQDKDFTNCNELLSQLQEEKSRLQEDKLKLDASWRERSELQRTRIQNLEELKGVLNGLQSQHNEIEAKLKYCQEVIRQSQDPSSFSKVLGKYRQTLDNSLQKWLMISDLIDGDSFSAEELLVLSLFEKTLFTQDAEIAQFLLENLPSRVGRFSLIVLQAEQTLQKAALEYMRAQKISLIEEWPKVFVENGPACTFLYKEKGSLFFDDQSGLAKRLSFESLAKEQQLLIQTQKEQAYLTKRQEQQEEIDRQGREFEQKQGVFDAEQKALDEQKQKLFTLNSEIERNRLKLQSSEEKKERLLEEKQENAQAQKTLKSREMQVKVLEEELSQCRQNFENQKNSQSLDRLHREHAQAQERVRDLKAQLQSIKQEIKRNFLDLQQHQRAQAKYEQIFQESTERAEQLQSAKNDLEKDFAELREKKTQSQVLIDNVKFAQKSATEKMHELNIELENAHSAQRHIHSELSRVEQEHGNHVKEVQKLREKLRELELELAGLRGESSQRQAQLCQEYGESILDEYVDIEDAKEQRQFQKQLKEAQESIEDLGDVNLNAHEDYKQAQGRQGKLDLQIQDLTQAQDKLIELMTTLDQECQKRFFATFKLVKSAFKRTFNLLFEGGEANLVLLKKTEQMEEGGLEIQACPPGKKLTSLKLLSGGEKCLTCLAFMFALFEAQPAPFCLLDEVDAPLDEANVERFVKLIASYSDKIQFFVITHNRITMQAASHLVGVSMPKAGITEVMTLSMDDFQDDGSCRGHLHSEFQKIKK